MESPGAGPGSHTRICACVLAWPMEVYKEVQVNRYLSLLLVVTTSTDSGFTAMTRASQYLIMPKHMSKELAEPMNINWKMSSIHRFENG